MIKDKSTFIKGVGLFVTFLVVLVLMFSPIYEGKNALEAADTLFNSIAKGSTYYIPDLIKKNKKWEGKGFDVTVQFKNQQLAQQADKLFTTAGVKTGLEGSQLKLSGDLGKMLDAVLKDSDAMFGNQDAGLESRYGFPGKQALYVWRTALKDMDLRLKHQKNFKEADWINEVIKKGIETGYNFFGIQPQSASSKAGVLTFSLVFYVIYTLWWGVAILFLFEGIGLEMKAGAKKEV